MSEMQKMTIQIGGVKYPITTAEDPAYVEELAKEMDKLARQLMGNSRMSINEALVLMALSYLDAHKKSERSADHLRGQIAEYLEEAAKARMEAGEARKELTRLENKLKGKGKAETANV